jgi:hypothetical protein
MWKANRSLTVMTGLLAFAIVLGGCTSTSEADNSKSATSGQNSKGLLARVFGSSTPVVLPQGTVIAVTLDQAISSEDSHAGETFQATVTDAVVLDGKTIIAKGSQATGHIVEAESSGRLHNPGRVVLDLASVEVGGTQYDIETNDAARTGKSHTKNNVIYIGGGSAAGAIIGGIVGGGKGAAIGAAAGAGGGTAAAAATGKMEVYLPAETTLRFPLSEPVTIRVKN